MEQFQPVSIKMAKTQGLSLNPAKISGACGRLMCCLKYEQEAYEDAVKRLPKNESFVETPDGAGNVSGVNFLRETVTVKLEDSPEAPQTYTGEEIRVIRNGKGRRPEGYVAPPQEELERLRKVTPRLVKQEKPLFGGMESTYARAEQPKAKQEQKSRQDQKRQEQKPRQDRSRDQEQGGFQPRPRRKHNRSGSRGKGKPNNNQK